MSICTKHQSFICGYAAAMENIMLAGCTVGAAARCLTAAESDKTSIEQFNDGYIHACKEVIDALCRSESNIYYGK